MPHAVLLGDSVFDNSSYTHGGPDVVTQLRALLPSSWGTSLGAVDGHTTLDIRRQVAGLPAAATHLALSVGVNDALRCLPVLDAPMKDGRQALTMLGAVVHSSNGNTCRRSKSASSPGSRWSSARSTTGASTTRPSSASQRRSWRCSTT